MTKRKTAAYIAAAYISFLLLGTGVGLVQTRLRAWEFALAPRVAAAVVTRWVILIPVFFLMRRGKTTLGDLGYTKEKARRQILLGMAAGFIFAVAMIRIFRLFGVLRFMTGEGDLVASNFLFGCLINILSVGLVEETVFRGYIFSKLLEINGSRRYAVLASSVLFGLSHLINLVNSGVLVTLVQVAVTTLIGLVFCLCRENISHFGTLSLVFLHGVYNAALPYFTALFGE